MRKTPGTSFLTPRSQPPSVVFFVIISKNQECIGGNPSFKINPKPKIIIFEYKTPTNRSHVEPSCTNIYFREESEFVSPNKHIVANNDKKREVQTLIIECPPNQINKLLNNSKKFNITPFTLASSKPYST